LVLRALDAAVIRRVRRSRHRPSADRAARTQLPTDSDQRHDDECDDPANQSSSFVGDDQSRSTIDDVVEVDVRQVEVSGTAQPWQRPPSSRWRRTEVVVAGTGRRRRPDAQPGVARAGAVGG
jgi:hypothetical protein